MSRPRMFLAACAAAVAAVLLYVAFARPGTASRAAAGSGRRAIPTRLIAAMPDASAGALLLFRHAAPGPLFGRLALIPLVSRPAPPASSSPPSSSASSESPSRSPSESPPASQRPSPSLSPAADETRAVAPISCERLHYAAGAGVCMVTDEGRLPVRHEAYVFDARFQRRHVVPLTGPPIRARVSPDGRRAALTVFETGHSYADAAFSTRTIVVDLASGRQLANLEDFAIRKDRAPFKRVDFNFWGVTFARDGDQFFATLKTGRDRYMVRGSINARTADVVREGVECPSLSPDERLIVFKKPMVQEVGWRLYVLDLATGAERPLTQLRRSVDDQVDWLDPQHIVFHDSAPAGTGIWTLAVDNSSAPRLLLPEAYSPAVQR